MYIREHVADIQKSAILDGFGISLCDMAMDCDHLMFNYVIVFMTNWQILQKKFSEIINGT